MNSPVLLLKRTLLGSTAPPLVCLFLAGFGFLSALHAQHTPVVQWDFSHDGMMLESTGQFPYTLIRANDLVSFKEDSTTGFLEIKEGGYLFIPRAACPALDFHGTNSSFTIVARIKRRQKSYEQCEAIAGMWNETRKKRQYYLFLNLLQKESGDQVCGHVSTVGGPTPGHRWAMDASIGATPIPYDEWIDVACSFDGKVVKSYVNHQLDVRKGLNPYSFDYPLFDGGTDGSDFTVGAVDRLGEMGNFFVGGIAKLAVYDRAFSADDLAQLSQ